MTGYDDILGLLTDLLFVLNLVYFCDNVMMYFLFPVFFVLVDLGDFEMHEYILCVVLFILINNVALYLSLNDR